MKMDKWDSLYNLSISSVINDFKLHREVIRSFPDNVLFDICSQLHSRSCIGHLSYELSDLEVFKKLLKVKDEECLLHKFFQSVIDYKVDCPLNSILAESFKTLCSDSYDSPISTKNNTINFGFLLGKFLLDIGWLHESETVYQACLSLCKSCDIPDLNCILRCLTELLHIRSFCGKFKQSTQTYVEAQECVEKIKESGCEANFARIYAEFAYYYLEQYNYKEAYMWALESLKKLNSSTPTRDLVRVYCIVSRASISKRKFKWSELLVTQALRIAKTSLHSLCYAATMRCYGYYLLSVDAVARAAKSYQAALDLLQSILGRNNLLVAGCYENLAYAYYSSGYRTGQFKTALDYADESLTILLGLLKDDNPLLICIKTIKALILEEIGINCRDVSSQYRYFQQAQELHLQALHYALDTFGDFNLFTAKHYGNLGRLYQSMKKFEEAQDMLLNSIAIKEEILGPEDYEVGFSSGLLASLYTFDMELYEEAEPLYMKSISIAKRMFGESFSGLEYDYKGLLRLYLKLGQHDKAHKYRQILHNWKTIRDTVVKEESEFSPLDVESEPIVPEKIAESLFSLLPP